MSEQLLHFSAGGHTLMIDRRDGRVRVCCNGVIYAEFHEAAVGPLEALSLAVTHMKGIEANAIKFPKENK